MDIVHLENWRILLISILKRLVVRAGGGCSWLKIVSNGGLFY
jgi:hypothetical protein